MQIEWTDAAIKEELDAFNGCADAIREMVSGDVNRWYSWVGNYAKDLQKHADRLGELGRQKAMLEWLKGDEEE